MSDKISLEDRLSKVNWAAKFLYLAVLVFFLFGVAIVKGFIDIGLPPKWGWIFVGISAFDFFIFKNYLVPKLIRKAYEEAGE